MGTVRLLPVTALVILLSARAALAQTQPVTQAPVVQPPDAFGTATSVQTIPVVAMTPTAGQSYLQNNKLHRFAVGGTATFYGSLDIPTGSVVTGLELEACDGNAAISVSGQLSRCAVPVTADCTVMAFIGTPLIGTPGCSVFTAPSVTNPVIDNQGFRYPVIISISGADATASAGGVRISWQRQVSPAPATATFADVSVVHPFHRFVEALVAAGVTSGCGGGNYCPDSPVTRGQMAVFLAVALGLHWPN